MYMYRYNYVCVYMIAHAYTRAGTATCNSCATTPAAN